MRGPLERGRVFVLVVLDVIVESLSNFKTGAAGAPARIIHRVFIDQPQGASADYS